jgi:hypothetical protein
MYVSAYVCMSPLLPLDQFIGFLFYFETIYNEACKLCDLITQETVLAMELNMPLWKQRASFAWTYHEKLLNFMFFNL